MMPARCLHPARSTFAVSTSPATTARPSVRPRQKILEWNIPSAYTELDTIRKKRLKAFSVFMGYVTLYDHSQYHGCKDQQRNQSRGNFIHSDTSPYKKSPSISPALLPKSPKSLP
ncbi:hypothetical protein EMIT0P218_150103 [Pseudomonas sp. IT-P218]